MFIWADEVQAHVKQPGEPAIDRVVDRLLLPIAFVGVKCVAHGLKQMNMAELKQLAKQKAIPYYNNFSKPQLVQAISGSASA